MTRFRIVFVLFLASVSLLVLAQVFFMGKYNLKSEINAMDFFFLRLRGNRDNISKWINGGEISTRECPCKVQKAVDGKNNLEVCPEGGKAMVGRLYINQSIPDMKELESHMLEQSNGAVKKGGCWTPLDCKARVKVAIVIPYRNREKQLRIFLRHMHPFLQRQWLDYRILVIEQAGETPFNRASLLNVGYREALKLGDYTCFVFSDVDHLPEDDRNSYGCPTSPRHMAVAVDRFDYKLPYNTFFGGVGSLTKEHFIKINGFSNRFWGWGGEDDDLYNRIIGRGFNLTRPSLKIGRYTMIKINHYQSHGINPERLHLLKSSVQRMNTDGFPTARYTIKQFEELPLFTKVTVELERK